MRATPWVLGLAGLFVLAGCNRAAQAPPITTPISPPAAAAVKASGLWIERVAGGEGVSITRICLDAASAQQLAALGGQLGGRCRAQSVAPADAGGWRFSSQCDMGAWGKVATDGVTRGDFASHYEIDALSQTVGAAQATADGPRRFKADISRQGACPKDMAAGEVVWPDGRRSRLADLSAAS